PPFATSTVIEPWLVSPFWSMLKLPSTLSVTLTPNRCLAMSAREPSEALMAFRRTWVAAAAYGVYGSSASGWYVFVKSVTNCAPAPFSWSGGTPATDAYRPSALAAPAVSIVDWVVNPSGSSSLTLPVFG